jgi:bloom syndrome protein
MYRNMILSPVYKEKLVGMVIDEAHCVKTWGDSFRIAYALLGDVRSILPSHINIMALTATATNETYKCVCKRLSLIDPVLIGCPPDRNNIMYEVKPMIDMSIFCENIAVKIKTLGLEYHKTVIFCQCYTDCAAMYHTLKSKLGPFITYPPNYPILYEFSVIAMYTRASKIEMKEKILSSFCDPKGKLRVIIATTAFGMGVDCRDIRTVFHWKPPSTLEQYMQESGRAGRDGLPSKAILMYGNPGKSVDNNVRNYGDNNKYCRRELLMKDFLFANSCYIEKCTCCDICKLL